MAKAKNILISFKLASKIPASWKPTFKFQTETRSQTHKLMHGHWTVFWVLVSFVNWHKICVNWLHWTQKGLFFCEKNVANFSHFSYSDHEKISQIKTNNIENFVKCLLVIICNSASPAPQPPAPLSWVCWHCWNIPHGFTMENVFSDSF